MTNFSLNKKMSARVASIGVMIAMFFALTATGALASFWRTVGNTFQVMTNGTQSQYMYGYGYGDYNWGYGYGYGYGYGNTYGYGTAINPSSSSSSSGGSYSYSSSSSSSSSSSGGSSSTGSTTSSSSSSSSSGGSTSNDNGTGSTDDSLGDLEDLLGGDFSVDENDGVVTITKADGTEIVFNDISGSFAKAYIQELAALGIISGYGDNTFRPEREASRAEYLKIVLRAMDVDYSDADVSTLTFSDVDKDSWIAKVVAKAAELNMIDTNNTTFRPNDNVSRAEAMKLLLGAAGVEIEEITTTDFTDVTGWAVKYVQTAKNLGIVDGQVINGKLVFRPSDSITRAEVAKIVVKTMKTR